MKNHIVIISAAALLLAACGNNDSKPVRTMHGEDIRAIIHEELAKTQPTPQPPPPAGLIDQQIDVSNPFMSDEEKAAKLRKYGMTLPDEKGVVWFRLHRADEKDVQQGLTPSTARIESHAEPIVKKDGDFYTIDFKPITEPPPKSALSATTTPVAAPSDGQ